MALNIMSRVTFLLFASAAAGPATAAVFELEQSGFAGGGIVTGQLYAPSEDFRPRSELDEPILVDYYSSRSQVRYDLTFAGFDLAGLELEPFTVSGYADKAVFDLDGDASSAELRGESEGGSFYYIFPEGLVVSKELSSGLTMRYRAGPLGFFDIYEIYPQDVASCGEVGAFPLRVTCGFVEFGTMGADGFEAISMSATDGLLRVEQVPAPAPLGLMGLSLLALAARGKRLRRSEESA